MSGVKEVVCFSRITGENKVVVTPRITALNADTCKMRPASKVNLIAEQPCIIQHFDLQSLKHLQLSTAYRLQRLSPPQP